MFSKNLPPILFLILLLNTYVVDVCGGIVNNNDFETTRAENEVDLSEARTAVLTVRDWQPRGMIELQR